MGRVRVLLLSTSAAALLYLGLWPTPVQPVAWEPTADPGFTGDFRPAEGTKLGEAELLPLGLGPEDVLVEGTTSALTGLRDGRVLRFSPVDGRVEELINTGGRPLGLAVDGEGRLLIADGTKGLLRFGLGGEGRLETLATEAAGVPMRLVDDVDVAADGTIYFSDASSRFDVHDSVLAMLEHRPAGRVLALRPGGAPEVLIDSLAFANGVTLSADGRSLLVCETGAYRVLRHHLEGPRRGETEVFIDGLPGFPDNIDRRGEGGYWLALVSPRAALGDHLARWPGVRKVLSRLPESLVGKTERRGVVVHLSEAGEVLSTLQDPEGRVAYVTSVAEYGDELLLGSYREPHVARLKPDRS